VSGRNVNQIKFFQHQLCLFSPGDGNLQKMAACNFYLYTWRQIKLRRNCNYEKPNYLTFGRAVSDLNVNEPKLSSVLTFRVELRNENVRFVDLTMFKQTHDNKFNAK